jgi:hypothetical protein
MLKSTSSLRYFWFSIIMMMTFTNFVYADDASSTAQWGDVWNSELTRLVQNITDKSLTPDQRDEEWNQSAINLGLISASLAMETQSPFTDAFRQNRPNIAGNKSEICKKLYRLIKTDQDFGSNQLSDAASGLGNSMADTFLSQFQNFLKKDITPKTREVVINFSKKPAKLINIATQKSFIIGLISDISPACDCYTRTARPPELYRICNDNPDAGKLKRK